MTEARVEETSQENQVDKKELSQEERLRQIAEQLAADLSLPAGRTDAQSAPLLTQLSLYEEHLALFHQHFQQGSDDALNLSYASEWVLDNYYILRQAIQQIREDLPAGYLKRLPKLDRPNQVGFPRIYFIARAYLQAELLQINSLRLEEFMCHVLDRVALNMGELWALPIFLRFTLIETIVFALQHIAKIDIGPLPAFVPPKIDTNYDEMVASGVVSLRTISNLDWKKFFEAVSPVENILRQDPAGIYTRMDFQTRDQYRKAVELFSYRADLPETEIARQALGLAQRAAAESSPNGGSPNATHRLEEDRRGKHVGFYLIDLGIPALASALGCSLGALQSANIWKRRPVAAYMTSIGLITLLLIGTITLLLFQLNVPFWQIAASWLLLLVPALTTSTGLTNWLVTLLLPPTTLPKLDLEAEIPPELQTLVIIPAMLTHRAEVESLTRQLELHYLRNPSPNLHFALLSDFADADQEELEGDEDLIQLAVQNIDRLNQQYRRPEGNDPFLLLHRKRVWSAGEGKWIGWERKRGKLDELNRLLHGETELTFTHKIGNLPALNSVRYVITLDADTVLPIGAANHLIGALAHPLNQALFAPNSSQVIAGYTILQPRVEISPRSANQSWFTRIFSGDIGLDLYSRAVSDVYQDLTGEGSYVGKGIYDVEAFERSTAGRIRENSLLSHDLLEGLLGRAGLVTDVTLVEDYPPNYFAYSRRQHRWIRGDWQLLPWLLLMEKAGGSLSLMDYWKIFDNLRRSLLTPSLVILILAGWTILPPPIAVWTSIGLLTLGIPMLTSTVQSLASLVRGTTLQVITHALWLDLLHWMLAVVLLPFDALNALNAILLTLYRLIFSRKHMLEWTTAAHTVLQLKQEKSGLVTLREMLSTLLLVIGMAVLLFLVRPNALAAALPLLTIWLFSPLVVFFINRRILKREDKLTAEQRQRLHSIAHRTWAFFEQFVGPEDHWLPPDHFQEMPLGMVAHRTSPTNIGLLLTSTLAAYDLGYLDPFSLASRLSATFETLGLLERYRGHFINWIDTRSLKALTPRYVSTVDSGNLAACLIATAQSLADLSRSPVFRWQRWQGFVDTLILLDETLGSLENPPDPKAVRDLRRLIAEVRTRIEGVYQHSEQWYSLFQQVNGPILRDITHRLTLLVTAANNTLSTDNLQRILHTSQRMDLHLKSIDRTIQELVPWIPMLENPPALLGDPELADDMAQLRGTLPYSPILSEVRSKSAAALEILERIQQKLTTRSVDGRLSKEAVDWLSQLADRLRQASSNGSILTASYNRIAQEAQQLVADMDFSFLYNPYRHVFHIGYNLDAARLDDNYYDLLASEARITSLIATAKGDVPKEHWLHLNRPITSLRGMRILLSWSATLFEYVMPALFLRSYPGTLLDESVMGAVNWQIDYGQTKGVPWGISESGFYHFDANQNYQYRAFGVPGLGFKRGLSDDLVIAPYASLMAVGLQPKKVLQNAERLANMGMLGLYGFYEAVDFTEKRLAIGKNYEIVRSYMAHHQGMVMLAMVNYLKRDIMIKRMHEDPQIQSVDLLLQEQIPYAAPLQNPESEDVKGTQRLMPALAEIRPWTVPTQTSIPQMHLLSNGPFVSMITNSGSGYLRWQDTDLTRWQPDGVLDQMGTWIYVQALDDNHEPKNLWSISKQPIPVQDENLSVTYHAHMAVYRRTEGGVTANLEVTVPPDDPVEIRRLNLHNPTEQAHRLRLTSYGEVILTAQANDSRHPAFNKLFIQSEYQPDLNLLIFQRRKRSDDEESLFMGHMLVVHGDESITGTYETDRYRFVGRGRDLSCPERLLAPTLLPGQTGSTLDPIFSLGQELTVEPHHNKTMAWLTFAAHSRKEIIDLAAKYQDWTQVDRSFQQAHIAIENKLRRSEVGEDALSQFMQLLSGLYYPLPALRTDPATIAANRLGQAGLWPFSISGDYPILLVQMADPQQMELIREALQAHRFWHERGFKIDLVILNEQHTDYGAEMNRLLYRLISRMGSDAWLNQRGGVFVIYADQMNDAERTLLKTSARVVLSGERGSLQDQLPGYAVPVQHLPAFTPSRVSGEADEATPPLPDLGELQFFNGYGGFTSDGREYVIDLPPGIQTPLPWSNIIGYPNFGFLVTESGSSTTWAINSGENRLTPWFNDPVRDPTGEALYLRDEETGAVWSPTPRPAGEESHFRVHHGAGYTEFEHNSYGLRQRLRMFADPQEPVKIIQLAIENTWDRPRRITATQYAEWVLGTLRSTTQQYLVPEYVDEQSALLAANPYSAEFGQQVAFMAASKPIHGLTADRLEFIGRNGTMQAPAALRRIGLERRLVPGDHTCAVLQVHMDLAPGGREEIFFILGQGSDRQHALSLIEKFRSEEQVKATWQAVHEFWEDLLGAVQVKTPDPAIDLLLNRWLLYQVLSCRIWGRTAFYQSSGAFGFRDQLQDVMAVLPFAPEIARDQILNAARHQFEEGDVLHWWHPPSGRGVRTRISDDLLWLPYVVAQYIQTTGDASILKEEQPFRTGPLLGKDEDERYGEFALTQTVYSIYEHCRRAIDKGATRGPHGLPLMGTGDWNDGMNRVGAGGQGESIWLAWFVYDTLNRFAAVGEANDQAGDADRWRKQAEALKTAISQNAWDGGWYLRAYYDDGSRLGSRQNQECQIDSIAQSWAVISGAGEPARTGPAMEAVLQKLVRPQDRLLLLFTPPFDKTERDPGYIKGYVPGIRENGGQYTHAATWIAWAFTQLGQGNRAGQLYELLNPIYQADHPISADIYKVEPYVIAADIYSIPPHVRRGGWTWYTGSSGWMYRLGLEALLGLRREGDHLLIDPVIPAAWNQFELSFRCGQAVYQVTIKNPQHVERGVQSVGVDQVDQPDKRIKLLDDQRTHAVTVTLG